MVCSGRARFVRACGYVVWPSRGHWAWALRQPAQGATVQQWDSDPASGQLIPEDGYDGTLDPGTVARNIITIDPADDGIITDLNVIVAITHEYVGDLTLKLRGPDGTTIMLVNRPGDPFNADDGADGGGFSANLSTDYPITFDDEAASGLPSEFMGVFESDTEAIGSVVGSVTNFQPSNDLLVPAPLSTFDGKSLAGDWTLYVGDSTPDEKGTGSLANWSLIATTAVSVPAPNAALAGLVLLSGIAGISLLRRRRGLRA